MEGGGLEHRASGIDTENHARLPKTPEKKHGLVDSFSSVDRAVMVYRIGDVLLAKIVQPFRFKLA